jgi:anti-sigma factor ChrR (cupin superfamily)
MTPINGNLAVRVVVDTEALPWTPSPSGTVWRKRLHLVGPPESGQVTSIVRYDPNSSFHSHPHPEGEEILVLEGIFSDEHGDWPAGTYLLNPEGFQHKPFSREGCMLFVKLRQFPGRNREHHVIETDKMTWQPTDEPGRLVKPLYKQEGFSDVMRLERWEPGYETPGRAYPHGVEMLILEGSFSDELGSYKRRTWLRLPAGSVHRPRTEQGCELYIKEGGFAYLNQET